MSLGSFAQIRSVQRLGAGFLLAAVVSGGVLSLFYFWNQLLKPGDLNAVSLPLVAFVAGIAATFNPCGMPALPGFLAFGGGDTEQRDLTRRAGLSLAVALGALTVVLALGIIVAIVGAGTKGLIAPYFRWVQLSVGVALIAIAGLHLAGQTERLPLIGHVMGLGSRMWEGTLGTPTPRGSYLFGAGFVAVGVGWTGPFLAAVAVFATAVGGFLTGLGAFIIFGVTMGLLVFVMSFLGASLRPDISVSLRLWGRRVQGVSTALIALVGGALIYSGLNQGIFDRLVLPM